MLRTIEKLKRQSNHSPFFYLSVFTLPRHVAPVTRPGNEYSRVFRHRKVCSMTPRNGIV